MARQRDFVADLGLALVDPGVGDVGFYLALEVDVDIFLERNVFGVSDVGIGFRIAVFVAADFGGFVPFAEG